LGLAVAAADKILLAVLLSAVLPLLRILVPLVSAAPGVIPKECDGIVIVGAGAFVGATMLSEPGSGEDTWSRMKSMPASNLKSTGVVGLPSISASAICASL
jgi:hypothetical protein